MQTEMESESGYSKLFSWAILDWSFTNNNRFSKRGIAEALSLSEYF